MTAFDEQLLQEYHRALHEMVLGNAGVYKAMYSERDDVTLANPFGTIAHGRAAVEARLEVGASHFTDGRATGFDRIASHESGELACLVEIERCESKIAGAGEVTPIALRVTSVFRLEDGAWKLIHRHADPAVTERLGAGAVQP
jgi:ketosteroid isomerase-like protein